VDTAVAPNSSNRRADWYRQTSAASVGIEIAVAICGGTFLGMWIEHRFTHWSPWTTMIGFGVGLGAAVLAVLRVVKEHGNAVAERRAAGFNMDGSPIVERAEPGLDAATVALEASGPPAAEDPELAAIRRRQKARPLQSRGPLP